MHSNLYLFYLSHKSQNVNNFADKRRGRGVTTVEYALQKVDTIVP